ncbi:MAG: hypothetical protein JWP12_666 [Bacteroidetes bacterium]|nr:hypothetical protein [Bacteroidota bacterium]
MRIRFIILSLTIGIIFTSHAQNLVPNPSFEISTQCPYNPSQVSFALPWTDPNNGSSDYFNACGTGGLGVPMNFIGNQLARTGNAYMGLSVYYNDIENWREYIQVKLNSTLEYHKNYAVEFYVSLADTVYTAANVSLYFSDTAISETATNILNVSPQIVNDMITNPLTDKAGWTKIYGMYTANGSENYITIGNFSDDANTDTIMVGTTESIGAYYYLDDVSVVCMDCDATGIDEASNPYNLNIYPNPAQNTVHMTYTLPKYENVGIKLYDYLGKSVAIQSLSISEGEISFNTTNLPNGVYFCSLTLDNAIISSQRVIISK